MGLFRKTEREELYQYEDIDEVSLLKLEIKRIEREINLLKRLNKRQYIIIGECYGRLEDDSYLGEEEGRDLVTKNNYVFDSYIRDMGELWIKQEEKK